ncbi:MAG: pitrilysin family protein [Isosphaeraceae bacterium]
MRQRRGLPCLPLLAAALAVAFSPVIPIRGADNPKPQITDLKVEKYTLPNGLEVVLHEDHTTPVVGVNIWYKVGSKNEKKGRTGFAHLFEHLMFQGSKHHDSEYFGPIEKVGAQINGSTNTDRTNYFETLPSNALELALWLESDRMGFLLPALTQAKLENQRNVVKNERRQRVDNVPYGQSGEKIDEALYPPDHPYHHSVIGSMADLSAAHLEDVSAFFRTYYAPNNASLVVAGDLDVAKTKALIEKYFGPIPRGPEVAKLKPWVPRLDAPKHLTMTDRVTLPKAEIVWPTVPHGHEDEQALDVLASVLGQLPRQNRLYRSLVYDRQIAASVLAYHQAANISGEMHVSLTARPGQKLDELVKIADAEIARLQSEGPTADEVRKVQNGEESSLVVGLQATTRKADFLNANNVNDGDPLAYKAEMLKLFAVTAADVKRVAKTYLTPGRVRLDVNPGPPTPRAPEVTVDRSAQVALATPPTLTIKDTFDRALMPKVGPAPAFTLPSVVRRKLSNGLEVLVAERHGLPILTLDLVVKGGETHVPADRHGLGALTASLMTEGTTTRDSLKIASELAEIGAQLQASGGLEASTVALTTLTRHRARALELFADVLLHPTFPEKELARQKLQRLAAIRARSDDAPTVASLVFPKVLYGDAHPYGRPGGSGGHGPRGGSSVPGTLKTIGAITRDDVKTFHDKLFTPNNASLVVVGNTTPDAIVDALESALKDWKGGEVSRITLPEPPAPSAGVTVYLVDKPAAAQSVLTIGELGVPRKTADYVPLTVLNAVLGGQFSSRINLNLREDKGYTYGARSGFSYRIGPGPFMASAPVQTAVTKEALDELVREVTEITGKRPVTDAELEFAKDRIIRGFPGDFETTADMARTLSQIVIYDLPADEFATYPARVEAVTRADVERVAKTYLHPDRITIVIVGDRARIEGPLKTLPYVRVINILDPEGNPLPEPAEGKTDKERR